MPILPRTKHQRSRGARRGVGGCGYLHISISSAQHRGWCRRAPPTRPHPRTFHVSTSVCPSLLREPNFLARRKCQCRGHKRRGSRIIIRVKGNSARFGIDRWNGAWCRANRPLFHRSINNFVSRATRWRKLERLHAF